MANKFALAGPDSKFKLADGKRAGFWAGLWHGLIMPITFFVSIFKPGVRIYETHNTGKLYDFGFFLGASMAFGGSKRGATVKVDHHDKENGE